MMKTPKSLRLHIGIVGRTNTGKSSFVNYVSGQDVAITSEVPGTTTDVVEKAMELQPLGPVVLLDTAGSDDHTELGKQRVEKSTRVLDRCDIVCMIVEAGVWTAYEQQLVERIEDRKTPLVLIVNKTDLHSSNGSFLNLLSNYSRHILTCSSLNPATRESFLAAFKETLIGIAPTDYLQPPPLAEDLLPPGGHAVLIVPIDMEAPKGRLILPQVQSIRALLDAGAAASVVKEDGYADFLRRQSSAPDLVICDSQVVDLMVRETPRSIPVTTFSILFARYKGDLTRAAEGAGIINKLENGDKVLIAEACSHHPMEDDIGRKKIPAWIEAYTGRSIEWTVAAGKDYPEELEEYRLIIHCGGCMLNRRAMLNRIQQAERAAVPITNYGLAIATAHGVGERVLEAFPAAKAAYLEGMR